MCLGMGWGGRGGQSSLGPCRSIAVDVVNTGFWYADGWRKRVRTCARGVPAEVTTPRISLASDAWTQRTVQQYSTTSLSLSSFAPLEARYEYRASVMQGLGLATGDRSLKDTLRWNDHRSTRLVLVLRVGSVRRCPMARGRCDYVRCSSVLSYRVVLPFLGRVPLEGEAVAGASVSGDRRPSGREEGG